MLEARSCSERPFQPTTKGQHVKACPRCTREIQDAAIKCRYCARWLVSPPAGLEPVPSQIVIRQSTTSGMAIASMVMGLLWVYWIGSVLAICFGYAAKREIRRNPGRIEGQGMATAGIVLGWIGIGILAATIALWVFIWKTHTEQHDIRRTKTTASTLEERVTATEEFACA
jgi:hypothetical protein